MSKKKIAYLTGTRADFGIMTPVLQAIAASRKLDLSVYVTGMHLMRSRGQTSREVRQLFPGAQIIPAQFEINEPSGMTSFFQICFRRLTQVFLKQRPDLLLVMGDRVEMLCAATVALYLHLPVAHIHGGERTTTVDELARHAITKLAHLHFPATQESALRIKKMGEEAWRIHPVGAPALDSIFNQDLPTAKQVYEYLKLQPDQKFILVTLHPISQQTNQAAQQMKSLLAACKVFHYPMVIVYPNTDEGGQKMIEVIKKYCTDSPLRIFPSIPYQMFLAVMREATVWVGNSSAGMIESTAFMTPVINVGPRQLLRQHDSNVIDTNYDKQAIVSAIETVIRKRSLTIKKTKRNIWGDGHASQRIVKILEQTPFDARLLNKQIVY